MARRFADRAIVSLAGRDIVHLQSASLEVEYSNTPVNTMSRDRTTAGFVSGNKVITVDLSAAIEERVHGPVLEGIDYEVSDVDITVQIGGEEFTVTSVWLNRAGVSAPSVGQEATRTWAFQGTDIINAQGSSVSDAFASGASAAASAAGALGL